ncbi:MAG: hypothetical protein RIQ33_2064 [Bacteroidota bacterium]|jgi:hypothetical protein
MNNKFIIIAFLALLYFTNYAVAQTNTFPSSGNTGIGTTAPSQLLEVSGGNIHLFTPNTAYMLDKKPVLWRNGNSSNIFIGVNAGNANLKFKI